MAGLVPAIHAFASEKRDCELRAPVGLKDVDPRHEAEDDDWGG
jgi:hypothetical protein